MALHDGRHTFPPVSERRDGGAAIACPRSILGGGGHQPDPSTCCAGLTVQSGYPRYVRLLSPTLCVSAQCARLSMSHCASVCHVVVVVVESPQCLPLCVVAVCDCACRCAVAVVCNCVV